ncbi:hypothetical protein L1887_55053 [Cichorium endivia]|nr:hypothetical protein L1887_55053 [Cichorium endivia]
MVLLRENAGRKLASMSAMVGAGDARCWLCMGARDPLGRLPRSCDNVECIMCAKASLLRTVEEGGLMLLLLLRRGMPSEMRVPAAAAQRGVLANESCCAPRSWPKRLPMFCSGLDGPQPAPPETRSDSDMSVERVDRVLMRVGDGGGKVEASDDCRGWQSRCTGTPAESGIWAARRFPLTL